MNLCRKILIVLLSFSFVTPSAFGGADNGSTETDLHEFLPEIAGQDLNASINLSDPLPEPLVEIAERKEKEAAAAPGWVKDLQRKKLIDYFSNLGPNPSADQWATVQAQLVADSEKLFDEYELDNKNSDIYKKHYKKQLAQFVNSLTKEKLTTQLRSGMVAEPIGEWTIESLVVREQLIYLGKFPKFTKNALNLISGRHLKYASVAAGAIVIMAATFGIGEFFYHMSPVATSAAIGTSVGGAIVFAFKVALGGPMNVTLDSVFGPTNQFIGIISSRYLGWVRRGLNNFYDSLSPKPSKDGVDSARNETPNTPDLEKDNMNYANQDPDERISNWRYFLGMFNGVESIFGQLIRGAQHAGRSLMMIPWSDEQITRIFVDGIDTKVLTYLNRAEIMISPYKDAILAEPDLSYQEKVEKLNIFEEHFDRYLMLSEKKWRDLSLSADDIKELDRLILESYMFLSERITKRTLGELRNVITTKGQFFGI